MREVYLGMLIYFVALGIAYMAWIGYTTYWYLIGTKVERDFSTPILVRYEDGSEGYVDGYSFKNTKWNNFIFNQYQKKFGA